MITGLVCIHSQRVRLLLIVTAVLMALGAIAGPLLRSEELGFLISGSALCRPGESSGLEKTVLVAKFGSDEALALELERTRNQDQGQSRSRISRMTELRDTILVTAGALYVRSRDYLLAQTFMSLKRLERLIIVYSATVYKI